LKVIWHRPGGLLLQFVALSVTPELPFHAKTVCMVFEPVLRGGFHPPTHPDVNCKTFISGLKQGRRQIADTCANEAIPGWGTGGLISHLYLQIIHGETVDLCS